MATAPQEQNDGRVIESILLINDKAMEIHYFNQDTCDRYINNLNKLEKD